MLTSGLGILKDTEGIENTSPPIAVKLPPSPPSIVDSMVSEVEIGKYPPLIPIPKEKHPKGYPPKTQSLTSVGILKNGKRDEIAGDEEGEIEEMDGAEEIDLVGDDQDFVDSFDGVDDEIPSDLTGLGIGEEDLPEILDYLISSGLVDPTALAGMFEGMGLGALSGDMALSGDGDLNAGSGEEDVGGEVEIPTLAAETVTPVVAQHMEARPSVIATPMVSGGSSNIAMPSTGLMMFPVLLMAGYHIFQGGA